MNKQEHFSLRRAAMAVFIAVVGLCLGPVSIPVRAQDGIVRHPPAVEKKTILPVEVASLPLDPELAGLDIGGLVYMTRNDVEIQLGETGQCRSLPRAGAEKDATDDRLCTYRSGKLTITFVDDKARFFEVKAATELPLVATSLARFGIVCPEALHPSPFDFTWRRGECFPYEQVGIYDGNSKLSGEQRIPGKQDNIDPRQLVAFVPKVLIRVETVPPNAEAPRLDLMLGRKRSDIEKHFGIGTIFGGGETARHREYERYQIDYTNLSLQLAEIIKFRPEGNVLFSPESPRAFGLNCPTDPASYRVSDWTIRSLTWNDTCPPYAWVRVETRTIEGFMLPSRYPAIVDEIAVRGGSEIAAADRRLFQRLAVWLGSEKLETPLMLLPFAVAAFVLYLLRHLLRRAIRRTLQALLPVAEYFEPGYRKRGAFITGFSVLVGVLLWLELVSIHKNTRGEVGAILSGLAIIPLQIGLLICFIGAIIGLVVMGSTPKKK